MTTYAVCPHCRTPVTTQPSGAKVRADSADQGAAMLRGADAVVCETCGSREAIEPWLASWRAAGAPYIDDPRSA